MNVIKLINNIANGYESNTHELKTILDCNNEETDYLFDTANKLRKEICGDDIELRGIIEFSNYCRCKCLYCGLNSNNSCIQRYRMDCDEIIFNAEEAIKAGYKTLVLQSGEDLWYTKERITHIVKNIKKLGDISITLSVGERTYEEYRAWKEAGADRYLMKHETADENLYNFLHPHSNLKNRIQCLKWLKELGYQHGSGFMIGLPNQTTEIISKDIMFLKELDVHMAGIGPFISHPQTKLKNHPNGSIILTLKAVALSRIVLKNIHLPATTALGVISGSKILADSNEEISNNSKLLNKLYDKAMPFNAGANVLMKKVEPYKYRTLYEIYPKDLGNEKTIKEERIETEEFLKIIGRSIGKSCGNSYKSSSSMLY